MRFLTLALIVGAVGLGGVALAQPSLIVDPWARPNETGESWFASSEPTGNARPHFDEVTDPWAPRAEANAPSVAPVGPVVAPVGPVDVPVEVRPFERASAPSLDPVVVDPWASAAPSEMPSLSGDTKRQALANGARTPWSSRLVEIVDPWRRVPTWASSDRVRLVVDPWAR